MGKQIPTLGNVPADCRHYFEVTIHNGARIVEVQITLHTDMIDGVPILHSTKRYPRSAEIAAPTWRIISPMVAAALHQQLTPEDAGTIARAQRWRRGRVTHLEPDLGRQLMALAWVVDGITSYTELHRTIRVCRELPPTVRLMQYEELLTQDEEHDHA